jgi:hypothetical protein
MKLNRRRLTALTVLGAGIALVVSLLPASAQQAPLAPEHPVTAGHLPTPQTDGIVFSVEIVGDVAYAGGRFSKARPAGVAPGGAGEVARHNLLAFNIRTGELLPWAPKVTGSEFTSGTDPGGYCKNTGTDRYICDSVFRIKATPGGTKLYVGGDFDRIDGFWRSRIAKFDTATGALDATFKPSFSSRVRALSITSDTVYVGGSFSSVGGVSRTRLAALTGAGVLKEWAPSASGTVFSLLASPDHNRVVVGGAFEQLNGATKRRMGAVSANAGASVPWSATVNGSPVVTDIATDGSGTVFLSAYDAVGGVGLARFEGRMAADIATGDPKWWDGCLGDTQAIAVQGGVVYGASHNHDCWASDAIPEKGADFRYFRLTAETTNATREAPRSYGLNDAGDPIPTILPWFPNTNGGPADSDWHNGPWAVDANSEYVVYGGEFTTVNGKAQQSLTRFAARGVSGAVNRGPQTPFAKPTLSKNWQGKVVVKWRTTWDAQNDSITYSVMKAGVTTPLQQVTLSTRPWQRPERSLTTTYSSGTFRVVARDADGAALSTPWSSIS